MDDTVCTLLICFWEKYGLITKKMRRLMNYLWIWERVEYLNNEIKPIAVV